MYPVVRADWRGCSEDHICFWRCPVGEQWKLLCILVRGDQLTGARDEPQRIMPSAGAKGATQRQCINDDYYDKEAMPHCTA